MVSEVSPRAPPNESVENMNDSINDPLLSAFASEDNGDASNWEDDRVTMMHSQGNTVGSSAASSSEASSSNSSTSSSSAPLDSSAQEEEAPRSSIWGGLLNTVSRPFKSGQRTVTDGVFGNLIAKEEPQNGNEDPNNTQPPLPDEDDDITPEERPPTYEEASADATPSYWETTIMTYSYGDEIIVGQMPVGSLVIFAWNLLMSSAFSYIGFILTYLFHTTHAAKGGSLVGFGITLIQSSHDMSPIRAQAPGPAPPQRAPVDPNSFEPSSYQVEVVYSQPSMNAQPHERYANSAHLANVIFVIGVILIVKGVIGYAMAIRMESIIIKRRREQQAQSEQAQSAANEDTEEDITIAV